MIDPLTRILNRRAILEAADQALQRRQTSLAPLAILLLDVDDFRTVNAGYGHLGGDAVLSQLGGLLARTVRPWGQVGRFGGDLFLVLAPGADARRAGVLGERLRSAVAVAPFACRSSPVPITITVGVGIAVADAGVPADFEQLRRAASAALDEAKRRKRGLME